MMFAKTNNNKILYATKSAFEKESTTVASTSLLSVLCGSSMVAPPPAATAAADSTTTSLKMMVPRRSHHQPKYGISSSRSSDHHQPPPSLATPTPVCVASSCYSYPPAVGVDAATTATTRTSALDTSTAAIIEQSSRSPIDNLGEFYNQATWRMYERIQAARQQEELQQYSACRSSSSRSHDGFGEPSGVSSRREAGLSELGEQSFHTLQEDEDYCCEEEAIFEMDL